MKAWLATELQHRLGDLVRVVRVWERKLPPEIVEKIESLLPMTANETLEYGSRGRLRSAVEAIVSDAIRKERRDKGWKCEAQLTADPPQDCGWPTCGCDPYADKVIAALEESGYVSPEALREKDAEIERLKHRDEYQPSVLECLANIQRDNERQIDELIADCAERQLAAQKDNLRLGEVALKQTKRIAELEAERDKLKAELAAAQAGAVKATELSTIRQRNEMFVRRDAREMARAIGAALEVYRNNECDAHWPVLMAQKLKAVDVSDYVDGE